MKVVKVDLTQERKVVTNFIVSDQFVKELAPVTKPQLFRSSYAKLVVGWVLEYYEHFKQAPGKNIKDLFQAKAEFIQDEDTKDSIAEFLTRLSKDWEATKAHNIEFSIKQGYTYLKTRSLDQLKDSIAGALLEGNIPQAEQLVGSYSRLEPSLGEGVSILKDSGRVSAAFMEEEEVLFSFPGALGAVVGKFARGDFLGILAPMKRGKCIVGTAKVILQDGRVLPMAEVIEKKLGGVFSMDSNCKIVPSQVSDFWVNGKKPVYRITTRTGRITDITANHPLFAFGKGWKSLDDGLSIGDQIAVPKNIPVQGTQSIPIDHVRLLACLLADGGLTRGSASYTKQDQFLMDEVKRIVVDLGDTWRAVDAITIDITKKTPGPAPTNTRALLNYYGVPRGKSVDKIIPAVIFTLPNEQLQDFIRYLFSGDGCIYDGGIEYCSGSEEMIRQLHHLLLRFGLVSKIERHSMKKATRDYWRITLNDSENVLLFLDKIGFVGSKTKNVAEHLPSFLERQQRSYLDSIPGSFRSSLKDKMKKVPKHPIYKTILDVNVSWNISREYLKRANAILQDAEVETLLNADVLWDSITDIQFLGEQETYDLSIPEYHNFLADDICVHNTWWMWYIGECAMLRALKVVFFTLEMTENQMIRRSWQSLTGFPKETGTITIPYFEQTSEGAYDILSRTEERPKLDPSTVKAQQDKMRRLFRGGDVKIISLPAYSASVDDLELHLDNLAHYDGFEADVVIVDYADIVAPSKGIKDPRHQLDDTWKRLRRMAQARDIFVCTASQAAKATFERDVSQLDVAEDIRKLAHVTHMMALNQTPEESEQGVIRVSQIAIREGRKIFDQAVVLQCLDIGKTHLDSRLASQVPVIKEALARKQKKKPAVRL